jgi:circadian clock protein KaiC
MDKIFSGIAGLDNILNGGLPKGSSIIVEGAPGTGKTTLGVQFLFHGAVSCDEPGIYITFEELPEQIYKDALQFGWDLRQLEKNNQLRVICMPPNIFLEQMTIHNGLLEQMIEQIQCRRVVIDSISLFQYDNEDKERHRQVIYSLRNILRKFSLTSLLIKEQTYIDANKVPFEHYVVDGVIRLSLKEHLQRYRKRTLEVLKMRGTRIHEGEHIYRITGKGIHLIPALSVVEDKMMTNKKQSIPTGIPRLDDLGGIPEGSVFMIDTNSKANVNYVVGSVICNRILAGEKAIILPSSLTTISGIRGIFELYGISLDELVEQEKIYFIEHYNRPVPPGMESVVINVGGLNNEEYRQCLREKLGPVIRESMERGEHWLAYYDLNTIFTVRGKDFVHKFFAEETARARALGITLLVFSNFAELGTEMSAYLERTSNGVIRTWVDGIYQYLQVTKTPFGEMSEPFIVEYIPEKPFIQLL